MDYLILTIVASYCPKFEAISFYGDWTHLFVAMLAKYCVVKYIRHVYTGCVYYLRFVVVKSYKVVLFLDDMEKVAEYWKWFVAFMKKDSLASTVVTLIIAFFIIKFIFFPGLSLVTGTSLPLVIVESCSMYHHEDGFENTFESDVYWNYDLSIENTTNWIFQNGFTKGDVIFVVGAKNVEVGDVIIFNGGSRHPLIHRVVEVEEGYSTKGDNYKTNSQQLSSEKHIPEEQVVGKALFKVPFIGWVKLIFFEGGRSPRERGFCD